MVRPYSLDLRERVVGATAAGQSCRAVATRFGVGVATVVRWSQRKRAAGNAAPLPMGGSKPYALTGERSWLLHRIAEQPDLTLRGIQAELATRGVRVSVKAIWTFFRAEEVTFKKKPPRRRAGPARRSPPAGAVEAVSGPG